MRLSHCKACGLRFGDVVQQVRREGWCAPCRSEYYASRAEPVDAVVRRASFPDVLAYLRELHADDERAIIDDLISWYGTLTATEAAKVLGLSRQLVQRAEETGLRKLQRASIRRMLGGATR